jgi:aspartyl-tRNA synthetase
MHRTHTCGQLTAQQVGEKVTLAGWVHRRRDHGGIIFVDLRDRYGLTQVKFDPAINSVAHQAADALRSEWVIKVTGNVVHRPADMVNDKISTGEIEVECQQLEVLCQSKTPPFEIDHNQEPNEHLRLKYRFVDLRRDKVRQMLEMKHQFIRHIRQYFDKNGFLEVQTPILANSSPEGARDFLVPSRYYPGMFYALPQAPQQFKQLLMVGGVDKYFQIAPCFRDEDPRIDRNYGEFYQLDVEMSFVEQEDIFQLMEPLMKELTEKFSDKKIVGLNPDGTFRKISWREAMEKYGSDKPDLRFDMPIEPVSELVRGSGFGVFSSAVENGGVVHALRVPGGAVFSRKEIDEFTELAKEKGAKGLAYIIVKEDQLQSPIVKFLGEEISRSIVKQTQAQPGDIIFFGADMWRVVCDALGAVRNECASRLGLKDNKLAAWSWIVDFPMYEMSEIEPGRIDFGHNPFSMPQGGLEALRSQKPLDILAYQFDLVINGFEASSGAIRNHDPEIMYAAFELAGYSKDEVDKKFGAMIRAFEYGAPPHGGNAPGIDRIMMVLGDYDSIRDMYAFPKDGQGRDVLMNSPGEVDLKQLEELGIKVVKKVVKA